MAASGPSLEVKPLLRGLSALPRRLGILAPALIPMLVVCPCAGTHKKTISAQKPTESILITIIYKPILLIKLMLRYKIRGQITIGAILPMSIKRTKSAATYSSLLSNYTNLIKQVNRLHPRLLHHHKLTTTQKEWLHFLQPYVFVIEKKYCCAKPNRPYRNQEKQHVHKHLSTLMECLLQLL